MVLEELQLVSVDGVLYVPVRVKPRASHTRILGCKEGALQVAVAAPPLDGAAKQELIREMARRLGLPKSHLRLASGQRGRNKRIAVQGLSAERCRELLSVRP